MAWIVGDSFDYYATLTDLGRSVWDSASPGSGAGFATGTPGTRFNAGQAIHFTGLSAATFLTKTIPTNESTLFVAVAFYRSGALSGTTAEFAFNLRDGATNQCSIVFESSGKIVLKSGSESGTVLATYTGAFAQDVWTHFQIRVVINNTTGSITVRKNGQTSDTFTATGLNTRVTANNYVNFINVYSFGNNNVNIDDLLFYSGTAPAPNDWIGDVRATCLMAVGDTAQKQMVPLAAAITVGTGSSSGNVSFAANTLWMTGPFSLGRGGVLQKITITSTGALSGNFKLALYANDGVGGYPGTYLGESAVVTSLIAGANDFLFSGLSLAASRTYYLAWLADATPTLLAQSTATKYSVGRTYSAGFPATAPVGMATTVNPLYGLVAFSGNATMVGELIANGDTDYVAGLNVNDADLYDMDDLAATPLAVIGVVSKVYIKKSDAGARSGQVLVKSGATQVGGTDTVLSSTYTYFSRVDATDPNTGVAWTPAAVNVLQVGQKVTV